MECTTDTNHLPPQGLETMVCLASLVLIRSEGQMSHPYVRATLEATTTPAVSNHSREISTRTRT